MMPLLRDNVVNKYLNRGVRYFLPWGANFVVKDVHRDISNNETCAIGS